MSAQIIDGKALAEKVRREVAEQTRRMVSSQGRPFGLAVIRIGDDPASAVYVGAKKKAAVEVGFHSVEHHLGAGTAQTEVESLIDVLNNDERIDGILLQLPLPPQLDADALTGRIVFEKDVDGFHAVNAGRLFQGRPYIEACTPAGVMRMLRETGRPLRGCNAVVVGRSTIVGRPMAAMLLNADCTVTVAHRYTKDLPGLCRSADIIVAAVGQPEFVRADWVKPGATVVDVGINRTAQGKLVGDVAAQEVLQVAGYLTPVPGGVGPMTVATLLANTVVAATKRLGLQLEG